MPFGIGDNLNVRVSAQTSDFTRGMEDAQDSLNSVRNAAGTTSGSLQVLQGRADEAADEMGSLDRQADDTRNSFLALSATTSGVSASLGTMTSGATVAATALTALGAIGGVIASLTALTAALTGAAAAALGLAGAFGGIIATGIFAYGSQLADQNQKRLEQLKAKKEQLVQVREQTGELTDAQQERLDSLNKQIEATEETTSVTGALAEELQPAKEQLQESALAIGEQFIPLIEDAIDALPAFIRQIEDSLGNLEPFAQALRDAGQAAFEVIPQMVAFFMDLARESLPALRELGSWFTDNWEPILGGAVDTTKSLSDEFMGLIDAILELTPTFVKLGTRILSVVLPALERLTEITNDAAQAFLSLDKNTQKLIAGLTLTLPILAKISASLFAINPVLGALAVAVGAFAVAWKTNFMGIRDKTKEIINEVLGSDGFEALVSGTKDLIAAAQNLARDVMGYLRSLDDEWAAFQSAVGNAVSGIVNWVETALIPTMRWAFENFIQPLIQRVAKVWRNNFDDILQETAETINAVVGYMKRIGKFVNSAWQKYGDGIVKMMKSSWNTIVGILEWAMNLVFESIEFWMNIIQGDWGEAWAGIAGMLESTFNGIINWLSTTAVTWLDGALTLIIDAIKAPFEAVYDWLIGNSIIKDMINDTVNWLKRRGKNLFGGAFDSVVDAAKDAFNWLTGTGNGTLIGGVTSTVDNMVNDIVGAFTGIDLAGMVNDAMGLPWTIDLPKVTILGQTIGGGSLTIPAFAGGGGMNNNTTSGGVGGGFGQIEPMASGGYIEQGGLALLHEGEQVVPAAKVDRDGSLDSSLIANEIARSLPQTSPTEVTIEMDGKKVAQTVIEAEDKYDMI